MLLRELRHHVPLIVMCGYFRVWFFSNNPALYQVADTPRPWASVEALCDLLQLPMHVFRAGGDFEYLGEMQPNPR